MRFFTKQFWNEKEIKNQHVHAWWAFWITFIMMHFIPKISTLFCGFCAGLIVEVCQVFKNGFEAFELDDDIRDLLFWTIGGLLNYFIYFAR